MITAADRKAIAELSSRLGLAFWHERHDSYGIRFIAGATTTIGPVQGKLVVTVRPSAAAPVEKLKRQLIGAGVLANEGEALVFARLPEGAEIAAVLDMAGLKRNWSAQ